jgi:hypothetical protein
VGRGYGTGEACGWVACGWWLVIRNFAKRPVTSSVETRLRTRVPKQIGHEVIGAAVVLYSFTVPRKLQASLE